jgi:hypothetical protein
VVFGWLFLGTWCARACGDGGAILLSEKSGGYSITVFAAPAPLRAGPVDISVLVQDASSGQPLPQTQVTVRMTKPGLPAHDFPATHQAATNKLLHAAQFGLPEPGHWHLEVDVEGGLGSSLVGGELQAAAPLPRWLELWPWIGWPALAVAIFALHQALSRRRLLENWSSSRRVRLDAAGGKGGAFTSPNTLSAGST